MERDLDTMCPELKLLVLKFLDVDELLNFSLVSKQWYHFVSSDTVWLEKFRLLGSLNRQEKSPNICETLSSEQLKQVCSYKFFCIYKTKLAFFLNKTNLIYNSLHFKKDVTSRLYNDFSYYGEDQEFLEWGNFDENSQNVVTFKIYHLFKTTRYNIVFLAHYNLPNQWIDAGVRYCDFRSCGNFCLAKVEKCSTIHVYRFSFVSGTFERTHELYPSEGVGLNVGNHVILTESTVSLRGQKFLLHYNLYTGETVSEIHLNDLLKPGETFAQMNNAGMSRLLLLVKYHTKKYVQEKMLLVDLTNGKPSWETKLNCLQSFMKLAISGSYIVVVKSKKTAYFQLSFTVYDVETGVKLYDVPYHPEYLDFKDWYLPPNRDILIVRCESEDYFYDLVEQERLPVTLDIKPPKSKRCLYNYEDSDVDESSDVEIQFDLSNSYYAKGPGDTVLLNVIFSYQHEMVIYLVDYRNNRNILVAQLGLKMGTHQLEWDKQFHHLIEYHDHRACGTRVYRLW